MKIQAYKTIAWVLRSIDRNNGNGSSGYYSLYSGWSKPYPETSGYLIETLINYHPLFPELNTLSRCNQIANWLITLFGKHGHIPGGMNENSRPLFFDTCQVLHGIHSLHSYTKNPSLLSFLKRLINQLLMVAVDKKKFHQWSYNTHDPETYNIRAIWSLLNCMNEIGYKKEKIPFLIELSSSFLANWEDSGWIKNSGFSKSPKTLSHTLAYSIRGCLEIYRINNDPKYLEKVKSSVDKICFKSNKIQPFYSEFQNKSSFYFTPVSTCQFGIILQILNSITQEEKYEIKAKELFSDVTNKLSKLDLICNGGVPGSIPIWGGYQRGRLINWGAKFYLDFCREIDS